MATTTPSSSTPSNTQQYAGHLAHQKHVAEQEAAAKARRAEKRRKKGPR